MRNTWLDLSSTHRYRVFSMKLSFQSRLLTSIPGCKTVSGSHRVYPNRLSQGANRQVRQPLARTRVSSRAPVLQEISLPSGRAPLTNMMHERLSSWRGGATLEELGQSCWPNLRSFRSYRLDPIFASPEMAAKGLS